MRVRAPDPSSRRRKRIEGIAQAREGRTRLFDPAITVERDIVTADGTLIAAAGTRINPFRALSADPRSAVHRRHACRGGRLGSGA